MTVNENEVYHKKDCQEKITKHASVAATKSTNLSFGQKEALFSVSCKSLIISTLTNKTIDGGSQIRYFNIFWATSVLQIYHLCGRWMSHPPPTDAAKKMLKGYFWLKRHVLPVNLSHTDSPCISISWFLPNVILSRCLTIFQAHQRRKVQNKLD